MNQILQSILTRVSPLSVLMNTDKRWLYELSIHKAQKWDGSQRQAWSISIPIIDKPVDALLSQLPSVFMVIVVNSPAEDDQSFRLGIPNVGQVLQQFLRVSTDSLKKKKQTYKKTQRRELMILFNLILNVNFDFRLNYFCDIGVTSPR